MRRDDAVRLGELLAEFKETEFVCDHWEGGRGFVAAVQAIVRHAVDDPRHELLNKKQPLKKGGKNRGT